MGGRSRLGLESKVGQEPIAVYHKL